jgi:pimeloyl-ACP methyl ester carboxylesterase
VIERCVLAVLAAACFLNLGPVQAKPVSLRQGDMELLGDLREVSPRGLADGVVLLLHGTLAHHRMEIVETLQSLLAEHGRNSLAVTLSLGVSARTGMYDCNRPHSHRHTDALDELDAWMTWLRRRGATAVTLLGHSRGGNQVARYALTHGGSALKALVLVAPATFDAARSRERFATRGAMGLDATIARARAVDPQTWLDDIPFLHCAPSRVTAEAFLNYYLDDGLRDTPALLPKITVPTLVVAGSADTTVSDVAARTSAHLDADTRLEVVDGADHFFRDLYAEDLADVINAFVEGL